MQLDITCTVSLLKIICHLVIAFKVGSIIAAILLADMQPADGTASLPETPAASWDPGLVRVSNNRSSADRLLASRGSS